LSVAADGRKALQLVVSRKARKLQKLGEGRAHVTTEGVLLEVLRREGGRKGGREGGRISCRKRMVTICMQCVINSSLPPPSLPPFLRTSAAVNVK